MRGAKIALVTFLTLMGLSLLSLKATSQDRTPASLRALGSESLREQLRRPASVPYEMGFRQNPGQKRGRTQNFRLFDQTYYPNESVGTSANGGTDANRYFEVLEYPVTLPPVFVDR